MFCPPSHTSPLTCVPGIVSCILFMQRSRVDLPHPEGPMIAVTCASGTSSARAARCSAASVRAAAVAGAGDVAGRDTDDEDEGNEDERAGPGLGPPVVVRAVRIDEDLERKRSDR